MEDDIGIVRHRRIISADAPSFAATAVNPVPYTGPGDVVSGATSWWGLRAYSSATIGAAVVRLIRSSDSTQADIVTVAGGGLNLADPFFNGSTYKIVTLYDQGSAAQHETQGTDAVRPVFTLSGLGVLPVMTFTGGLFLSNGATYGANVNPFALVAVGLSNGGSQSCFLGCSTGPLRIAYGNTGANTWFTYDGVVTNAPASDATWHVGIAAFNASPSVNFYIDGGVPTVGSHAGLNFNGTPTLGAVDSVPNETLSGQMVEAGVWERVDFAGSGRATNMNTNIHTYWGF